jgi:hypothetical protein
MIKLFGWAKIKESFGKDSEESNMAEIENEIRVKARGMKKKLHTTILLLCVMLLVCGCGVQAESGSKPETEEPMLSVDETIQDSIASDSSAESASAVGGTILLSFERISENVTDAQGNILAQMYIDKPILALEEFDLYETSQESDADDAIISRINAYFEEDAKGFFYGSEQSKHFAVGSYDYFFDTVAERRKYYSDEEILADTLLHCTVDSKVAHMTRDILSIRQNLDWIAGGVHNLRYYGSTFDLNTGELLTLDRFISDNKETFVEKVLSEMRTAYPYDTPNNDFDDYENFLAQLNENDISEQEFYFDGHGVHLIFNKNVARLGGYIIRYPD